MTPVNMQVPPPVVTGIVIPGDIGRKTDKFEEIKQRQRDATYRAYHTDEFSLSSKKKKNKVSKAIKFIGGALLAGAAYLGLKKLF